MDVNFFGGGGLDQFYVVGEVPSQVCSPKGGAPEGVSEHQGVLDCLQGA